MDLDRYKVQDEIELNKYLTNEKIYSRIFLENIPTLGSVWFSNKVDVQWYNVPEFGYFSLHQINPAAVVLHLSLNKVGTARKLLFQLHKPLKARGIKVVFGYFKADRKDVRNLGLKVGAKIVHEDDGIIIMKKEI